VATAFAAWLASSSWTASTLARSLTRRGVRTSRAAVHEWTRGGAPNARRIAVLERITEGEITARSFEASCCCVALDGGGTASCCKVHEWEPVECAHP